MVNGNGGFFTKEIELARDVQAALLIGNGNGITLFYR